MATAGRAGLRLAPLRRLGILGAAAVLLALASGAPPALSHPPGFPDVDESHVGHDAIEFLSGAQVIDGYTDGRFGPEDVLKRGQAAKILVRWKRLTLSGAPAPFLDLDDTYRAYVQTAYGQGWIAGFADGGFKPYAMLTREQMAIIMVRATGREKEALDLPGAEASRTLSVFSDQADISAGARPYVAVAVARGLFQGTTEGRMNPQSGITRAQFCLVVMRAELSAMATVERVSGSTNAIEGTRVTLHLSQKPGLVRATAGPEGILNVDFTGGAIAGSMYRAIDSAEVKSVDVRQFDYVDREVRITLDLGRYRAFRVMYLAPAAGNGHRIVVDVYERIAGRPDSGPPLVCVDPGHGGRDPGAIGVTGTKEKDINLAIALLLAKELREAGLQVLMTRDSDSYPTLQDRADMANAAQADLFVSIHNNAVSDGDVSGTMTFYWGTPESYSAEGKLLAESIQRNLVEELGSRDLTARTHWYNLVVLAETEMVAALVEVGFLTNAAEEARLLKTSYRGAAAKGICEGILEYLGWSTNVYTSEL